MISDPIFVPSKIVVAHGLRMDCAWIVGVGDRPGSPSGAYDFGVILIQNYEENYNAHGLRVDRS